MKIRYITSAVAAAGLAVAGSALAANVASQPVSSGGVTPWIIPGANPGGNRTCAEVGFALFGNASYYTCWSAKRDFPGEFALGFDDISGNALCERNVIEVTVDDEKWVSFTAGPDGVGAAIIKGSSNANVYLYQPQSGGDSGLASPLNASGMPAGLSNIGGFCWNPIQTDTGLPECFEGETAWANGSRYVRRGNWATYTRYQGAEKVVTLFAGKTLDAGDVLFSAPVAGVVTITIALDSGWRFALKPVGEEDGMPIFDNNVKVQDYATAPSGNPAPGLFLWKIFAEGDLAQIEVPQANFYGVHADVERSVECPE